MLQKVERFYWTPLRVARLLKMRDVDSMEWSSIAKEFGPLVTDGACRTKYAHVKSRQRIVSGETIPDRKVPNAVAIECSKRIAARSERDHAALERGNITPAFFGDPPPGYSALDQKRAGA